MEESAALQYLDIRQSLNSLQTIWNVKLGEGLRSIHVFATLSKALYSVNPCSVEARRNLPPKLPPSLQRASRRTTTTPTANPMAVNVRTRTWVCCVMFISVFLLLSHQDDTVHPFFACFYVHYKVPLALRCFVFFFLSIWWDNCRAVFYFMFLIFI